MATRNLGFHIGSRPERRYSKFARRRAQMTAKLADRNVKAGAEGEEGGEAGDPMMQGWLSKQGGPFKAFKKRWFVLWPDGRLEYYAQPDAKQPKGMIPIQECHIGIPPSSENRRAHCFFVGRRMMKTYYIFAKSRDEQLNWIRALTAFTEDSSVVGGVELHKAHSSLPPELLGTRTANAAVLKAQGARGRGATLAEEAGAIGLDLRSPINMVYNMKKTMQRLDDASTSSSAKVKELKDSAKRVSLLLRDVSAKMEQGTFDFDFSSVVEPLSKACQSGDTKLIELGINGFDSLLEYSHLHESPTEMLKTVISSIKNAGSVALDENLQFRVVKVCGSAVLGQSVPGPMMCELLDLLLSLILRTKNVRVQQSAQGMMKRIVLSIIHRVGEEPISPMSQAKWLGLGDGDGDHDKGEGEEGGEEEKEEEERDRTTTKACFKYKYTDGECEADSEVEALSFEFPDRFHRDAFDVVNHLIMKVNEPVSEIMNDTDDKALQCITWIDVLSTLLETPGPLFSNSSSDAFVYIVRRKLTVALLSHCVSPHGKVFRAALGILASLTLLLREYLKVELYVLYTTIVLRVMDAPQTTAARKTVIVEELFPIFGDSQCLVELYLNYDCETECDDVFQRLMQTLSKYSQGHVNIQSASMVEQMNDMTLREVALEAVGEIAASLMRFVDDEKNQSEEKEKEKEKEASSVSISNMPISDICAGVVDRCIDSVFSEDALDELAERARKKEFKMTLAEAIKKFNYKPEKGISYFLGKTGLTRSPESVSRFLLTPGLDATNVGEYLGGGKEFHIATMHAYVDQLDFTGMSFDEGLRYFLSLFWLPGEGQKIDRIMERFSMQFVKNNPESFRTPDAAYVLAYSIIMLNTDAHSAHIKNRMTEDEFVRNNRGIDEDLDLPEEFLRSIYKRIVSAEIKMRKDVDFSDSDSTNTKESFGNMMSGLVLSSKKRRQQAEEERKKMVKNLAAAFTDAMSVMSSKFYSAHSSDAVKNMMDTVWGTFLTTFSSILKSEDEEIIVVGLNGFKNCIITSAAFDMTTQIDVFVSTLTTMMNKNVRVLTSSLIQLLGGDWVLSLPQDLRATLQSLLAAVLSTSMGKSLKK